MLTYTTLVVALAAQAAAEPVRISFSYADGHTALAKRAPWHNGAGQITPPQNLLVPIYIGTGLDKLILPMAAADSGVGAEYFFQPDKSSSFQQMNQTVPQGAGSNRTANLAQDSIELYELSTAKEDIGMVAYEDFKSQFLGGWNGQSSLAAVGFGPGEGFARNLFRGPPDKRLGLYLTQNNGAAQPGEGGGPAYDLNAGELTIGGVNDKVYDGGIQNMPLINESGWGVALDGIKVDGQSVDLGKSPATAYIQSPLPLISMRQAIAEATMAMIPGSKYTTTNIDDNISVSGYEVPCNTTANLTFTLGGKDYTLPPKLWVRPFNASDQSSPCRALVHQEQDNVMAPGVGVWLGHPFISSVYTVFDFASTPAQIGFAPLNAEGLKATAERIQGSPGTKPTGTIPGRFYPSGLDVAQSVARPGATGGVSSGAAGWAVSRLLVIAAALVALL